MNIGCCSFISELSCWNLFARPPCIKHADDHVLPDLYSRRIDNDSDDGAELLAEAHNDSDDGEDLLSAAIDGCQAEYVLSILRQKPGLVRIADPIGDTVFHVAARVGNFATVCKLMLFMQERQDLKLEKVLMDTNVDGNTALHLALMNSHQQVAYYLARANKEVASVSNNDGIRPVELAEKAGYSDVRAVLDLAFRILCSGIADLDIRLVRYDLVNECITLRLLWDELHGAINMGMDNVKVMGFLRGKHGKALLCHQDRMGETLLHAAVKAAGLGVGSGPFLHLFQLMIDNGLTGAALIENRNGDTALHLALHKGELKAAMCLIKAAPRSVNQVNRKGVSPLYLAVKGGHHDLVKYMFQTVTQSHLIACATELLQNPMNTILAHLAIKAKSLGMLQTLMEHLPELINQTDEKGWMPLSYAAYKGHLDEVTYFLDKFPETVNKFDKDGSLPIHKAVGGGHVSILEAFFQHCPHALQQVDVKVRSILHIAVRYGRTEILTYLTQNMKMEDSFLNLTDNEGKTFMDYSKAVKP